MRGSGESSRAPLPQRVIDALKNLPLSNSTCRPRNLNTNAAPHSSWPPGANAWQSRSAPYRPWRDSIRFQIQGKCVSLHHRRRRATQDLILAPLTPSPSPRSTGARGASTSRCPPRGHLGSPLAPFAGGGKSAKLSAAGRFLAPRRGGGPEFANPCCLRVYSGRSLPEGKTGRASCKHISRHLNHCRGRSCGDGVHTNNKNC
jgi:hypothetical protein